MDQEIPAFFVDWLRENNLLETERAFLQELQSASATSSSTSFDKARAQPPKSGCCGDSKNDINQKDDQTPLIAKPFPPQEENAPRQLSFPLEVDMGLEPASKNGSCLPPCSDAGETANDNVDVDVVDYEKCLEEQLKHFATESPDDGESEGALDEWSDSDDLGYVRLPAHPTENGVASPLVKTPLMKLIDTSDDPQGKGSKSPNSNDTNNKQSNARVKKDQDNRNVPTKPIDFTRSIQNVAADERKDEEEEGAQKESEASRTSPSEPFVSPSGDENKSPDSAAHPASSSSPAQDTVAASGEAVASPTGSVTSGSPTTTSSKHVLEAFDLKVIYEARKTGFEEHKDYPIRIHAVVAGRYQILEYLGSAAFSRAVQCIDLKSGQLVCLKIIRNNKDFFDQGLDEIKLLQYINTAGDADEHSVLQLYDYFYHKEHLFLVCELLRDNLYEFSKYNRESGDEPYFTMARLQKITRQVLKALKFIHSLNLIHCDLKPENILIKSYSRCEVKVIDFGSTCFTTDHLSSYVQSRCYRAPEVVLGYPYTQKIDLWSLGAILAELFTGRVLFQNDSVVTMLARIIAICGPIPSQMLAQGRYADRLFTKEGSLFEKDKQSGRIDYLYPKRTRLSHRIPNAHPLFVEFVGFLLQINPINRPTAAEALEHPFLQHDFGPINV